MEDNDQTDKQQKAEKFVMDFYKIRAGILSDKNIEEIRSGLLISRKEWDELLAMIEKQRNETQEKNHESHLKDKIKAIELYFLDKLSKEFIEEHFSHLPSRQKKKIEETLKDYMLRIDSFIAAENVVSNMLTEEWLKTYVYKDKTKNTVLDYLGYGWLVLVNIISIVVILTLFTKAKAEFDTILLSVLAIILLNITHLIGKTSQAHGHSVLFLWNQFKHIRRKVLKEPISFDDEEYENDEMQKALKILKKATIRFWINSVSGSIIYFIVLYKLFIVL